MNSGVPSRRHSITCRMTMAVCAFVILFLSFLAMLSMYYFKREVKQTISAQQMTLVTLVAQGIDQKLTSAQKAVVDVSRAVTPGMVNDPRAAQHFLDNCPGTSVIFDNGLFLLSREGRLIAESPFRPDRRGRDIPFRDFYKKTIATGKPDI